ncbi:MAG: TorF family putative porin [Pseudomonadota bacterium]|nr:TorF family putative porin [Pseudomonadota bacterium]
MRVSTRYQQPLRALALSILSWLLAPAAQAQLSGSAGLLSNYLYRGVSLSDDKPAARLALNYDGMAGWFAGGQVVAGQLVGGPRRSAQWSGYAGYAQRLPSGLSWETGVSAYAFPQNANWNFREVYVGLSGSKLSGRLHYSSDYLGFGERTLYGELNGGAMLTQHVQAFWHGGYLYSRDNALSRRAEARIGLSTGYQGWKAQLSLDFTRLRSGITGGRSGAAATTVDGGRRHYFFVTVARAF